MKRLGVAIWLIGILLVNSRATGQTAESSDAPKGNEQRPRVEQLPNRFDEIRTIGLHHVAEAVAFSPADKLLVTADRDGRRLMGWHSENGERAWVEELDVPGIKSLSFTRDGARVVLELAKAGPNSHGSGVAVFDLPSRRLLWNSAPLANATALDTSPDDRLVAISRSGEIEIRDLATGKVVHTVTGHNEPVEALLFSPDAKRLLSATSGEQACLWDVASGERVATLATVQYLIYGVAFTEDQVPIIVTDASGDAVRRWGKFFDMIDVLSGKRVEDVGADGSPLNVPVRQGYTRRAPDYGILPAVSKNRKSVLEALAGPCFGLLVLASRESGAVVCGDQFDMTECGFTPDDRWAYAVVSEDMTVGRDDRELSLVLWNPSTCDVVARIQPPGGATRVQFSQDGASAVIVGKKSVWLWTQVDRLTR